MLREKWLFACKYHTKHINLFVDKIQLRDVKRGSVCCALNEFKNSMISILTSLADSRRN